MTFHTHARAEVVSKAVTFVTPSLPSILIQQITARGIRGQYLLTCRACGCTSVEIEQLVAGAVIAHINQCKGAPPVRGWGCHPSEALSGTAGEHARWSSTYVCSFCTCSQHTGGVNG